MNSEELKNLIAEFGIDSLSWGASIQEGDEAEEIRLSDKVLKSQVLINKAIDENYCYAKNHKNSE